MEVDPAKLRPGDCIKIDGTDGFKDDMHARWRHVAALFYRGVSEEDVSIAMGVSVKTVQRWKSHPEVVENVAKEKCKHILVNHEAYEQLLRMRKKAMDVQEAMQDEGFECDANGIPVVDQATGRKKLTSDAKKKALAEKVCRDVLDRDPDMMTIKRSRTEAGARGEPTRDDAIVHELLESGKRASAQLYGVAWSAEPIEVVAVPVNAIESSGGSEDAEFEV
jgi:hypothetical protein